ncbi:hypothetical protein CBL_20554, partial [Carabus blaptoides fortunei]
MFNQSDENLHTFFDVCENNIQQELNPVYNEEENIQAFFQICDGLIQDELNPVMVQEGRGQSGEVVDAPLRFNIIADTILGKADLPPSIKKGYFPHLFNTLKNSSYVGPIPAINFYGMKEEIVDYCVSDVDILRRACVKFRQTFIKDCGVCPFTEAVTIASACNKVFRRRFLKHRTIGLIPENGYRMNDNQSKVALEWLIWEEETRQIRIEQAARGREAVLDGNLKVDDYYETEKLVFEFHGCFYHGHDLCFRTNRDAPILNNPQETLNSQFDRTVAKTNKLRELG